MNMEENQWENVDVKTAEMPVEEQVPVLTAPVAQTSAKPQEVPVMEDESAEKEEYWNGVLTGDVMTIPKEVRQEVESRYAPGMADNERLSAGVMQSWVADMGGIPRERIRYEWKEIREQVARQYGASGKSDHELFMAVSQHNQVRLTQRQTLFELYQEAYDQTLSGVEKVTDARREEAVTQWGEDLRAVASSLRSRAVSDALDDRNRLSESARLLRKGLEGLVANESPGSEASTIVQVDWSAVSGMPDVVRAVDCLANLDDEDRQKVFRMMEPSMRSVPGFADALDAALKRGVAEVGENVAQLAVNGMAWALPEGGAKATVDRYARSFEELRRFARMEFAPLRGGQDAPWFREMIVDMAQQGAATALAFGGPVGIGALLGSETGRHMADARQMNKDGVFDAQMGGAVLSGGVNTVLSVGMTKLGQNILGQGMKTFHTLRAASGGMGAAAKTSLAGAGLMAGDAVKMAAENKLMELTPMLMQEGVGLATDRASGVDWEAWKERQMSLNDQMREAGMMMPFLLIGAGKSALHHFRQGRTILGDGTPLKALGIPDETIAVILKEQDVYRAGEMLQTAIRKSPLWGSLFISKKAMEWSRALDAAGEPFLKTEQEARDFLDMPSPVRPRPWDMEDFPPAAVEALKSLSPDPVHVEAKSRWLLRAGLPRLGESMHDGGQRIYDVEHAPGMPLKRVEGKSSREEALSTWYETLCRMEEDDLGLNQNRNGREIPWRLRNMEDYDVQAEDVQQAFVTGRLKKLAYRPYKMLLLAYPDEAARRLSLSKSEWDARTVEMIEGSKANVYEGVMERVSGRSHAEVAEHVAERVWKSFCRDDDASALARRWLEEGSVLLNAPDLLTQASAPDGLSPALGKMSSMMAALGDRARHQVSPDLREMNRQVWGAQADVNSLFHVLPNMKDFDLLVGRGYSPVESYGRLLSRFLELPADRALNYATVLDADRLSAGPETVTAKRYPGTEKAVEYLQYLMPELFQTMSRDGAADLWRVHYPNGKWSVWHDSRDAASMDLMAHMGMVFASSCTAKQDLIRGWQWNAQMGYNEWDTNYMRLTNDRVNSRGEMSPCLFDSLSAMAVSDLLRSGYGRRGSVGSGDLLEVTGKGRVAADGLMSTNAIEERKGIHEKYVGDVQTLGVDADNRPVLTANGLVVNLLRLHNAENPLALIEDKAEIVWDRLLRTEQISTLGAWSMLQHMGRVPRDRTWNGETELIEELSQLSNEYFFAHLDDKAVPETVAMWARYGAASPENAQSILPGLVKHAMDLKARLADESYVPAEFLGMIRETVGMNDQIRAERGWLRTGPEIRLPMMERYAHSLMNGNVLASVPEHVRVDLTERLATADGYGSARSRGAERAVMKRMEELGRIMKEMPDLNQWRPDPERPGLFLRMVPREKGWGYGRRKGAPVSDFALDGMNDPIPAPVLKAPNSLKDDFVIRKGESLPAAWKDRPDILRALETLEIVRSDFADRPEATSSGIMWRGNRYRSDSDALPPGVRPSWMKEVPLDEAMDLIATLDRNQDRVFGSGAMLPLLAGEDEPLIRGMYKNCVQYRDPDDSGHLVRLMPGIPEIPLHAARAPYVVHSWNGVYLDRNGLPVRSERDSYIPLECFTGAGEEPSPAIVRESRARVMARLLETLSMGESRYKYWWHEQEALSCFMEDVIRLYEEQGVREGFMRGSLDLFDPVMVQSLRFVSHVLNDPLVFRLSLDRNTRSNSGSLKEGKLLKKIIRSHGKF